MCLMVVTGLYVTGYMLYLTYRANAILKTGVHAKGRIEFQLGKGEVVAFDTPRGEVRVPKRWVVDDRERLADNAELDLIHPANNPERVYRLSDIEKHRSLGPIGVGAGVVYLALVTVTIRSAYRRMYLCSPL